MAPFSPSSTGTQKIVAFREFYVTTFMACNQPQFVLLFLLRITYACAAHTHSLFIALCRVLFWLLCTMTSPLFFFGTFTTHTILPPVTQQSMHKLLDRKSYLTHCALSIVVNMHSSQYVKDIYYRALFADMGGRDK